MTRKLQLLALLFSTLPVFGQGRLNGTNVVWQTNGFAANLSVSATGATTSRTMDKRLSDVTVVDDFGADPTGVADSTAAFNAAIAYATNHNGHVFAPGGFYKVTSVSFRSALGLTFEGGQGFTNTTIIGGETGYPMFDLISGSQIHLSNLHFQPTEGISPSCAILMGRASDSESSGSHVLEKITSEGNFQVASVYTIASEQNRIVDCQFSQFPAHTHVSTAFYSGKSATNIYSTPIVSYYHTLTATGGNGNGLNVFEHTNFRNYTTSSAGGSSAMVIEYGQGTTVRECYIVTAASSNQVVLIGSTTGLTWSRNVHEQSGTQPYASIAILDTNTYQGIDISASMFPIWATNGSQIAQMEVHDSTLVASTPTTQYAVDVWNIKDSRFRFSKQLTPYSGNVTGFGFHVRGASPDNVDFGTQFLSAEVITVSANTNQVTHYGNQYFPNFINGGTLIADSVNNNTGYSFGAFANRTTGQFLTQFGQGALQSVTTATTSTGIGESAGSALVNGSGSTFLGRNANTVKTNIANSMALGSGASVTNDNEIALGNLSAATLHSTAYATLAGVTASGTSGFTTLSGNIYLSSSTNGSSMGVIYKDGIAWIHDYGNSAGIGQNFFAGGLAGNFTMSSLATRNIGIGQGAIHKITDGHQIVAIGTGSGANTTTGSLLVLVGSNSGVANTTGANLTIIGDETYQYGTIGDGNTVVGNFGLNSSGITNMASITAIGHATTITANGLADSSSLGDGAVITKSHQVVLGSGSTTELTVPTAKAVLKTANFSTIPVFANNAAAISGGLAAGDIYRTGADPDPIFVVH